MWLAPYPDRPISMAHPSPLTGRMMPCLPNTRPVENSSGSKISGGIPMTLPTPSHRTVQGAHLPLVPLKAQSSLIPTPSFPGADGMVSLFASMKTAPPFGPPPLAEPRTNRLMPCTLMKPTAPPGSISAEHSKEPLCLAPSISPPGVHGPTGTSQKLTL